MPKPATALVSAIEEAEKAMADAPEPMEEVVMIGIPMPLYKALSDVGAQRNLTFAQMLARAFDSVLKEQ